MFPLWAGLSEHTFRLFQFSLSLFAHRATLLHYISPCICLFSFFFPLHSTGLVIVFQKLNVLLGLAFCSQKSVARVGGLANQEGKESCCVFDGACSVGGTCCFTFDFYVCLQCFALFCLSICFFFCFHIYNPPEMGWRDHGTQQWEE